MDTVEETQKILPRNNLMVVQNVKPKLRNFACHEKVGRRKVHRQMENYLYECIYDILHSNMPQEDRWLALQKYKENIIKLHAGRLQTLLLDND